jgi:sodium-dependent phosphate cotransporter
MKDDQNLDPPGEAAAVPLPQAQARARLRVNLGKVGLFFVSLFLFILGIAMMKDGAGALAPVLSGLSVDNPADSLGFGWLSAYLILSGSPVAASTLTFYNNGLLDQMSTFAMIIGSRMGAGFIVLFIGFLYVLRGRDRSTSLSMGLLSLTVTYSTYLLVLPLGLWLLRQRVFQLTALPGGALLHSITGLVLDPIVHFLSGFLPLWALFLLGLGIIIFSLQLFDRCLPVMSLKESQVGQLSRLVYRPLVMFLLGAAVTLISMSVSMSLSILVPLSSRGFVRRENVIPYIMGANVTTFIDTLFAALLLNNPGAFALVFSAMLSITLVSVLVLGTVYHRYERLLLAFTAWATAKNRHLMIFMFVIFLVPLILLFF